MSAAGPMLVKKHQGTVLVVSPHVELREQIRKGLGPDSLTATGGADALLKLSESDFHTLLLDPDVEDLETEALVATIHARYPGLNVVMLDQEKKTRHFLFNSCHRPEGLETEASRQGGPIAASAAKIESLPGMIGASPKIEHVYHLARLVAPRDTAVLIMGATGTGKELVARGIHQLSARSQGPLVVVNCAAIPESLLEAELFGFTRGAFTGAFQSRLGRIHSAHGGTLLLDEIGEMPLSMQAKLLRFVQDGEVQRLGSADTFQVDTRLIASTNADLRLRVREKQFREDLYYRLAVFPLELPPLRDRAEDILPLARRFLETVCQHAGVPLKLFSLEAVHLLQKHLWPGNVRELQHSIERAFVLSEMREQIRAEDLAMPSEIA
jgi:transcriptional regulator with GAF, ATPase, and Fis domain